MSGAENSQVGIDVLEGIFDITAALLSDADEEDVLQMVADRARRVVHADTTALVLPSVGGSYAIEFSSGEHADDLVGTMIRPDTPLGSLVAAGKARSVRSVSLLHPSLRGSDFGAAACAPLAAAGVTAGGLLVLQDPDAPSISGEQMALTRTFATQAALAMSLAEARHAREETQILQERQRIARDLHDLAIQQLFAVGLQLENLQKRTKDIGGEMTEIAQEIGRSLQGVDLAVTQIRSIVQSLRSSSGRESTLSERIQHETSLATGGLGFAPTLRMDAEPLDDPAIDEDLADDIVAVVREGLANAARHAQASAVSVAVTVEPESDGDGRFVRVNVVDNGRGIDPSVTRSSGLSNLKARARRHNGWAQIYGLEPGTMVSWRGSIGYRA